MILPLFLVTTKNFVNSLSFHSCNSATMPCKFLEVVHKGYSKKNAASNEPAKTMDVAV